MGQVLRIIHVEDNSADKEIFRFALEQTGTAFEIVGLSDGLQAIEYLLARRYLKPPGGCDLVLLDLNLPKANGLEVLQFIKANEDLSCVPVIVMSGSNDSSEVERCYQAGACAHLCKPSDVDDVFAMVAQLVAHWGDWKHISSQSPR